MRRIVFHVVLLLALVLPVTGGLAAPAQQANGPTLSVQAGYDGFYQDGAWLPLRIEVSNNGPDISGELRAFEQRTGRN